MSDDNPGAWTELRMLFCEWLLRLAVAWLPKQHPDSRRFAEMARDYAKPIP
jgi:hypothetical protein